MSKKVAARRAEQAFTVIQVPDMQFWDENDTKTQIFEWIRAAGLVALKAVIGVGDNVNVASAASLAYLDAAWGVLDAAEIPYMALMGNHDYDDASGVSTAATYFDAAMPQVRYTAHPWWTTMAGEFYGSSRSGSAYLKFRAAGQKWGILTLNWPVSQAEIDWADGLLSAADAEGRISLVFTHNYMNCLPLATRNTTGDPYNQHSAVHIAHPAAHDGSEIWNELIKLHDVLLVVSGHQIAAEGDALGQRSDVTDTGRKCWQLCRGHYSGLFNLFVFQINPALRTIAVRSPNVIPNWVGTWDTGATEQFTLSY